MQVVPWSDDEKRAFLSMQFEAQTRSWDKQFPDAEYSIVEVDNEPAGRLYLDRRADEIRIVDIALTPDLRNQGIGSTLLKAVFDEAKTGRMAVRIHVEKNNPALRLYRRQGFQEIADKGVYLLMERPAPTFS